MNIVLRPKNENYQEVIFEGAVIGHIWRFLGTWRSVSLGSRAKGFEDPMVAALGEYMAWKNKVCVL